MATIKGPDHFLFVYGSLAPGQPNAHILKPLRGTWKRATVRGFLHERGWASKQGFPGLELDSRGDEVQGQLFTSKGFENYWQVLDDLEGPDYERVTTLARLPGGKVVKAYVYVLQEECRTKP